jgi:23S rRNA pseudouridine1911/1915/1917 synthase
MIKYKKNERSLTVVEILYKSKNAVVIYKPAGVPSQSDPSGDPDAMTLTRELLRSMGEGDSLWLVHRLDRVVGGLIIFARNKRYAAILSEQVQERLLTKEYYAVVDGSAVGGVLEGLIYKDARAGKAFIVDRERAGVKRARLSYRPLSTASTPRGVKTLVYVTLDTGRFHQIRAQLSHEHLPITGDGKYGSRDNGARNIALMAAHLSAELPNERVEVSRLPDLSQYPWSLFDEDSYIL